MARSLLAIGALAATLALAGCGSDDAASPSPDGPQPTDRESIDPARVGPQGRVAQFVVECELSHLAFDDPIVYPNEVDASHLHTFFGNESIDEVPDYERVAGAPTSCEQRLDTASYWAPALLDAGGQVVEPVGMTGYYRPGFGVDPAIVEPYPAGLMLVAGDSLATDTQPIEVVAWSCGTSQVRATEPPSCPADGELRLWVNFPDCWDGDRLRGTDEEPMHAASADGSDDGELTMAMAMRPAPVDHSAYSASGSCPATHPVAIPMLQLAIDYPPVDPDGLALASGDIRTAHADFWNVWDQDKLEQEVELCLNADRVCGVTD